VVGVSVRDNGLVEDEEPGLETRHGTADQVGGRSVHGQGKTSSVESRR
jgi:hypothetical protein